MHKMLGPWRFKKTKKQKNSGGSLKEQNRSKRTPTSKYPINFSHSPPPCFNKKYSTSFSFLFKNHFFSFKISFLQVLTIVKLVLYVLKFNQLTFIQSAVHFKSLRSLQYSLRINYQETRCRMGCSTVINSFVNSFSHPFLPNL